jgi:hypothetical protein
VTEPFSANLGTTFVCLYTRSINNDVDRSRNLNSGFGETGAADLAPIIEGCIASRLIWEEVVFVKR